MTNPIGQDSVTEAMIAAGDAVLKRADFSFWEKMDAAEGHELIRSIIEAAMSQASQPPRTGEFRNSIIGLLDEEFGRQLDMMPEVSHVGEPDGNRISLEGTFDLEGLAKAIEHLVECDVHARIALASLPPLDDEVERALEMLDRRGADAAASGGICEIAIEEIDELRAALTAMKGTGNE